jgi:hypothetical protein
MTALRLFTFRSVLQQYVIRLGICLRQRQAGLSRAFHTEWYRSGVRMKI